MVHCKRILIVDDDVYIREALQAYLEFEGYEVRSAANGLEALTLLKIYEKPCMILLDLMMPIMTGWEFAKAIEEEENFKQIPIVVVSAFSDRAQEIKALALLTKPLNMDELMGWADECCTKR